MLIPSVSASPTVNMALDTLNRGKQAIIFASSKISTEKTAKDIAAVRKKQKTKTEDDLARQVRSVLAVPTMQCEKLADIVQHGVCFHHAGLHSRQRELLEQAFRDGKMRIIVATPTLAAGVSLPAFRTIIRDLKRYSGWGMQYIPVLEYLQQAGRAGRPEYDAYGEAIMIAKTEAQRDELHDRFILGVPEDITSKLAVEPVLRTYVLSLVATGFVSTTQELLTFFAETFWAQQFGDMDELMQKIRSVLLDLIDYGFVEYRDGTGRTEETRDGAFLSAASLHVPKKKKAKAVQSKSLRATTIGSRVSELYVDPDAAHDILEGMAHAGPKTAPLAYLLLLAQTTEVRTVSVLKADVDRLTAEILSRKDEFLQKPPDHYADEFYLFLAEYKTARILERWTQEISEDQLLLQEQIRPGELHEKISRMDWLLYAATELARLSGRKDLVPAMQRLRTRVKYGVKEELLTLLALKGIGRVRARQLYDAGIRDIRGVKEASESRLSALVGRALAAKMKQQVTLPESSFIRQKRL